MKYKYIILSLLLLGSSMLKAQPPETTYLGSVVYEGYYDDRGWGPYNLGFNFTFYGNTYSQFYVTSNGLVMFGSGSSDFTEDPIPSASSPNNFIAAFWDDIVINQSGKILFTTIGASPNRKCIIQWTNMGFFASTVLMGTFSVILYEGSNNIQIQYRSIIDNTSDRSHGSSATIGLENLNGTAGVQYAFHNSSAIASEQAILFTPAGSTYSMNSSATYDGIYLTKNMSLPEPGIPKLISPAKNGVIGASHTFLWSTASNTTTYTLKISTNSDISGSTDYNAGTNTSYEVSGLTLNSTYYWAVFASNSTGTTWSEINRFTTSSNPPLSAIPQTIWMEQGEERSIRLQYTGGDANSKTAFISSLPSQGSLYQYISGSKGARITTIPATVSDADFNVIYSADGGSGNGAGSFNFYIHDNTGDSPVATTTINVNPPGVPNFLLAAKAGDIEIQFDKPMADPTGKESQFTVKVNGTPVTISSVSLKSGDPYTIVVSLATPLTGSETVLISYTQGDVVSESGGSLPSFVDQPVNFLRQTITFPALLEMTYGDEPVTLTASASSGLPVTFISSNTSVASVTGTTLTANSPGSVNITAQQVGNGTYAPARYIRILVVNKADQVITFPTFPEKRFGDPDFSPGAASSSGLAVTYSSSDESVATIVNNNIRITGSGSAVITASQEGNNLYNPANNVTATLIIDKSNQTITFNVLPTKLVGDADFSPGATSTSGLEITYTSSNTGVATVNGNLIHIISAGTTTITASQPGNTNYNAATPAAQVLTVEKGSQTITFNTLPEVTYGDPDFSPGATASSSLTITYTSSNTSVAVISAGLIHITGAGLSVITASQAGDDDFSPAPDVQQTLTVDKASQSITFGEMPTRVFGDADFNPAATASSGLVVTYSSSNTNVASITGNSIHITGAGTAVITASQAGDNNYLEAPDISHSLTVQKAAQTITFPELPYGIYGGADILPAATASSGLEVSYSSSNQSVAAISDGRIQITGAGTVIITASQAGNDNYEAASGIQRTLIIGKADQTITFGAITSLPYGSSDFNPGATATSGLSINYSSSNTNVAVISGNMLHITGAGNATITASQPGDNNYNAAPDAAQLFVVAKADQSITFSQLSEHTFGDSPFNLNVSASSNLSVTFLSSDPVIASVSGTLVTIHRAGSVIITAHQPGDEDYNAAPDVSQTLVVKKAGQSISFAPFDSHKFGDPDINPGAISSSGLGIKYSSSNTAIAIITGSLVHIVGAGTVNITASQEGNSDFEPAPDVTQTLTVDKADQTILFPPVDQVIYGTEPFNPRASSSSGLEVTYSSNNTAVADISGGMIGIKGAGTAVITALQEGDDNYNPAENEEQTLVVTKAMLIVTAGNQTKAYLATNPELTFTYSGFVYNENESVIDISPVVQTEALQDSPVGEYTVTLGGGSDNNYDFTYIAGVLTITRIPQTVTFTSFPTEILVNETFDLQAIASSGLSVSFESDNTQVAMITGSILKGVSGGTVIIKAYQEGNENYSPAEATVSVEVIATHKNILNLFTPNNDGFNDHWEIPELDSYGKCDVRVYNRWGKLVFSSKDYHNEWDGKSDGVDLPEAAYYYILKTESFGTITGTVNIVR